MDSETVPVGTTVYVGRKKIVGKRVPKPDFSKIQSATKKNSKQEATQETSPTEV